MVVAGCGRKFYPGNVEKVNVDGTYEVVFKDGERVKSVKMQEIRDHPKPEFIAPDGRRFPSEGAYKKHVVKTELTFSDLSGETLTKPPGSIAGRPFALSRLEKCEVRLMSWSGAVTADKLTGCRVLVGPVSGSIFVRDCVDCEFSIACRQLRLRDCEGCTFWLATCTDPIIERSTRLRFGPFNGSYAGLREDFALAKLDPGDNHWRAVFDFNEGGKDGYGVPDPHYELLDPLAGKPAPAEWRVTTPQDGDAVVENPVSPGAVATTVSDAGHAFGSSHDPATKGGGKDAPGCAPDGVKYEWAAKGAVLENGTRVMVNFEREGGKPSLADFYGGVVSSVAADGTYSIHYDDGDDEDGVSLKFIKVAKHAEGKGPKKDVTTSPDAGRASSGRLATECRVEARIKGWKQHYSGTVKKVNTDGTYAVVFDDGERVDSVSSKEIKNFDALLSSTSSCVASTPDSSPVAAASDGLPAKAATRLSVGTNIEARIKGWKQNHSGTVKKVNADGTYAVVFDDGDYCEDLSFSDIVVVVGGRCMLIVVLDLFKPAT